MKIPPHTIIPPEKLRDYLLVRQERNDKSRFLAAGGFNSANWPLLEKAIRDLARRVDAVSAKPSPFGQKWLVDGIITGPAGKGRSVRLIWIEEPDGLFRFITLLPRKSGLSSKGES